MRYFLQVIPYEHKGKRIIGYQLRSVADVYRILKEFRNENDIWLKKLLAVKLIDYLNTNKVDLDKSELLRATECQIK